MRLFLDAHISGRWVGGPLRERGHDVVAAAEHRDLDGKDDDALLALATAENRVLVTFDVKDFGRIVRVWAEAGRTHAGCIILVRIDHSEYGTILRTIDAAVEARPEQTGWRNYAAFVSRSRREQG